MGTTDGWRLRPYSAQTRIAYALICLTSESALSATREFMDHGIAVPEDIAIVGFDDADEHTA